MRLEIKQLDGKWFFSCVFGEESHSGEFPVDMRNYAMLSEVMKVFSHYSDLRIKNFKDKAIEDFIQKENKRGEE